MVTTRPPKTIVKPTALGPVANTDTKLLIYGLFQKGLVLAQDDHWFLPGANHTQRLCTVAHDVRSIDGQLVASAGDGLPQGAAVRGATKHPVLKNRIAAEIHPELNPQYFSLLNEASVSDLT